MAEGYTIVNAEAGETRFTVSADVRYDYRPFTDEQKIRLYEGGLHVAGSFTAEPEDDNVIVDGDLTIDGDLDWWYDSPGVFLVVTGDLRARNVLLWGCVDVVVRGNLIVDGGVLGDHGQLGGYFAVHGRTEAAIIVNCQYFTMTFASRPEATVVSDPNPRYINCAVDLTVDQTDAQFAAVAAEGLVVNGWAAGDKIRESLLAGRPILSPAEP